MVNLSQAIVQKVSHNKAINADAKKLRRSFLALQLFVSGYGWRYVSNTKGVVVNLTKFTTMSLLLIFLAGCASMNTPSSSLIETKPIVKIGEPNNSPEDHIIYIPANKKFAIEFSVKGSVFNEPASSKKMVSFKQDMYLYKYWASLDGKTWVNSHKLMSVEPSGGFDASGGKVEVKLNLVQ